MPIEQPHYLRPDHRVSVHHEPEEQEITFIDLYEWPALIKTKARKSGQAKRLITVPVHPRYL